MSSIWRYILGAIALAGIGFFLYLTNRLKKTGLEWAQYPGFCLPPSLQNANEWFQADEKHPLKKNLLNMLLWAPIFPVLALLVAAENASLELKPLQYALKLLPLLLLLLQEAEIIAAHCALHRGKGVKAFCTFAWIKWILLGLWLLGFFASLLIRGFQL